MENTDKKSSVAALLEKGYGVRLGEIAPQPFFCEFFHLYLSSY